MTHAGEATRGSAIKLGADFLGRGLTLATTLIVADRLGPSGFGQFTFWSAIAVVVADLGDLGLQLTATRALAARTLRLVDLLRARLLLTLALAGIVIAGAFLSPLFALLTAFFVLSNWVEFLGVSLRAERARLQEALVLAFQKATCLALVCTLGQTLIGAAWAHVLSPLLAIIIAVLLVRRVFRAVPATAVFVDARTIMRQAFPLGVNNMLSLASLRLELVLLTLLRGNSSAGLFAIALRFIEFVASVPAAIAAGALPMLAREAQGGQDAARRRTVAIVALLAVPAAVGLFLVAPQLIQTLEPAYLAAVTPLRLLAGAAVPLFMNGALTYILVAKDHGAILPRLTLMRLGAAGLCSVIAIPSFGAAGAACGFCCAEMVLLLLLERACRRNEIVVPIAQPLLAAAVLTAPMAVCVSLVRPILYVQVGVGGLCYLATCLAAYMALPQGRQRILG
ncbi:MAG: polysaccharide biosynthesis C-terminal domain-containing protein [Vicinamibacteria bacterium]|nr:polysaccharide biosynthesis C-terminal domain-containing protein [Vicinamibacteria bacterium]